jgi:hypothetical protein
MSNFPKLLDNALTHHTTECVPYLIKQTNCNPNLPLYNSIKLTNKKEQFIQVSDGNTYITKSKKKIIAELIENKRSLLQTYIDEHPDTYGQRLLVAYQRYVDSLDDDEEAKKELEIDVISMLVNITNVIGTDEWTQKLINDLKKEETDTQI